MFSRLTDALGGLFGGDAERPDPVRAEDPWEDLEVDEGEGYRRISGTAVLPAGSFATQPLETEGGLRFEADFDTGGTGSIDLYLVPEHFLDNLETGGPFASDSATSVEGRSSADYQAELGESRNGPVHAMFDNSWRGETEPDGEVRVEFEIAVHE